MEGQVPQSQPYSFGLAFVLLLPTLQGSHFPEIGRGFIDIILTHNSFCYNRCNRSRTSYKSVNTTKLNLLEERVRIPYYIFRKGLHRSQKEPAETSCFSQRPVLPLLRLFWLSHTPPQTLISISLALVLILHNMSLGWVLPESC